MRHTLQSLAALPRALRYAPLLRRPPPDWQARRDAGLRRMAAHCWRAEFYRRRWEAAGVKPDTIRGAADIPRLPIIPRAEWRAAAPALIERREWPFIGSQESSGGTTGARFAMPYSWNDIVEHRAIVMARYMNHGLRWHELITWTPLVRTVSKGRYRRSGRVLTISLGLPPDELFPLLRAVNPYLVRCSAWQLWRAVVAALRSGQSIPKIPVLIMSGEVVTATLRRTLQRHAAVRLFNLYGATDSGYLASDCDEGRLHIGWPTTHLEMVNGDRPCAPGEEGEVIVSNFALARRPVMRVGTGDRAAWGAGDCACGNPAPHLAYVAGREQDRLCRPDGRRVSWPAIERALTGWEDSVLGWQCEQLNADDVVVRLSGPNVAASLAQIETRLRAALPGLSVSVVPTDEFRTGGIGKTRPVIGPPAESNR